MRLIIRGWHLGTGRKWVLAYSDIPAGHLGADTDGRL